MKRSPLRLCAIAVLAASIAQPSFAKTHRPAGGKPAAARAALSKSGSRKSPSVAPQNGPAAKSEGEKAGEPAAKQAPAPDLISHEGPAKPPGGETGIRLKPPDLAHRPPTPGPTTGTARNAIGVPVVPKQGALTSGGEHAPAAPLATGHLGPGAGPGPSASSGSLPAGHQPQITSGATAGAAKISGAALLRPHTVPSGLAVVGGAAKPAAGINGTTMRPKR